MKKAMTLAVVLFAALRGLAGEVPEKPKALTLSEAAAKMWHAIQTEPARKSLVFGDSFYVELFSGSPGPVNFNAWIHETIEYNPLKPKGPYGNNIFRFSASLSI